jgi:phosphoglycolate phosphatase-like HAD superfamily hydrolase
VLKHIRLLILDLDYLVFDCALLKTQALRESLVALSDDAVASIQSPDGIGAEEGFRNHGFRWLRNLDVGFSDEGRSHLHQAYSILEKRLIDNGMGRVYSGIEEFIVNCRQANLAVALGADASREYMFAVIDRHQLDTLFQFALCVEEFGSGSTVEMLGEIMHQAEVNPSETLALGTRPHFFQAAHHLDMLTIGCGWGLSTHEGLADSDFQALTLKQLFPVIQKADEAALRQVL